MRKLFLFLLPLSLWGQCGSQLAAAGNYGVAEGASGPAQFVVAMPEPLGCYNGTMILFAHGFVPAGAPAGTWLSQLALPDGTTLPQLVNAAGFGFAASSFSKDGLAILQGEQDTHALTNVVAGLGIPVARFLAAGASEGGLIAAKLVEDHAEIRGGLAVCGPEGSFRKQLDYIGDVRVLFDYFFPGVLPGDAINIPLALILQWDSVYEPAVRQAINSRFFATWQLLSTAKIPIGLSLSNAADAIVSVLRYNVFATTEASAVLGGNPYDNIGRVYRGSFNDARLNAMVDRFAADPAAVAALGAYETTGLLSDPVVTLHNLADPTVPYWQVLLYAAKVAAQGRSSEFAQVPSLRYGHCNVSANEAKLALGLLVLKVGP